MRDDEARDAYGNRLSDVVEQQMRYRIREQLDTMKRIQRQRDAINTLLSSKWVVPEAPARCWHAVYYLPSTMTYRAAQLLQRRGAQGFELGIVQDVALGGAEQLKSPVLTTIEAVIFLGLHELDEPPHWELAL